MADNVTLQSAANAGVPAGTVFGTLQMSGGAHVQGVIGGLTDVVTKEWTFTTSQTDFALVSVSAGSRIVVTRATVTVDESTSVSGINVRLGFAASTLPGTSTSGATGIILSHAGLVPGSGQVEGNGSGILGQGADAEDLRFTCETPTSGSVRVVVTYSIRPT